MQEELLIAAKTKLKKKDFWILILIRRLTFLQR